MSFIRLARLHWIMASVLLLTVDFSTLMPNALSMLRCIFSLIVCWHEQLRPALDTRVALHNNGLKAHCCSSHITPINTLRLLARSWILFTNLHAHQLMCSKPPFFIFQQVKPLIRARFFTIKLLHCTHGKALRAPLPVFPLTSQKQKFVPYVSAWNKFNHPFKLHVSPVMSSRTSPPILHVPLGHWKGRPT